MCIRDRAGTVGFLEPMEIPALDGTGVPLSLIHISCRNGPFHSQAAPESGVRLYNRETLEAKIAAAPERADIELPIEETLIVELYSK